VIKKDEKKRFENNLRLWFDAGGWLSQEILIKHFFTPKMK